MNIFKIPSKLYRLYTNYYNFIEIYRKDKFQRLQHEQFLELQMEAFSVHQNVFPQYYNCNKGRDVAIIGSGPTLDKWRPIEGLVQIGVNGSFLSSNVKLDYWFMQDYDVNMITEAQECINYDCKKFMGIHYMLSLVKPIPFVISERMGAERYFFYDSPVSMFPFDFTIDIASKPFITYGSTIFVALQFALYTHPKRIYIVGCDCSTGHFALHKQNIHDSDVLGLNKILEGWKKFANFAKALYPDIEIVCVNPVGLKGLFIDEYTE